MKRIYPDKREDPRNVEKAERTATEVFHTLQQHDKGLRRVDQQVTIDIDGPTIGFTDQNTGNSIGFTVPVPATYNCTAETVQSDSLRGALNRIGEAVGIEPKKEIVVCKPKPLNHN